MNEDILEKVRKDYIHNVANIGVGNWDDISDRLSSQNLPFRTIALRVIVILAIPSLLLTGVVGVSQASKPGEFFYPVKVASEKIVSNLTNRLDFKIEKKAQEVLSEKDENIENKINSEQENKKTFENSKEEIKQKQESRVTITNGPEKKEQKSEKATEENGKGQGIENAKEQTQKVRQEPEKGKSEENKGRGKINL